jgi:DNA-binding CsgD family transcriptional regulator
MRTEPDLNGYIQDLERHLQLTLFGGCVADPEGAVLLVRGALAGGDRSRAARLADATRRLAVANPGSPDMAAAADHARGLVDQNPAVIERAVGGYSASPARAGALEDAGNAWAERGNRGDAVARLRQAHALYEALGAPDDMARVRADLRAAGTRLRHWHQVRRPAYGWDSLTDTQRHIAELVAEGLSNRQVARLTFLSTHTVAFHLRHVFWKLGVTSRVQVARMAAEHAAADGGRTATVIDRPAALTGSARRSGPGQGG